MAGFFVCVWLCSLDIDWSNMKLFRNLKSHGVPFY